MKALNRPPSADDFLPVLIYVVVRAQLPSLYLTVKYISVARHPSKLVAEPGYYFTNLVSALSWIDMMDASFLSIDKAEFDRFVFFYLQSTSLCF